MMKKTIFIFLAILTTTLFAGTFRALDNDYDFFKGRLHGNGIVDLIVKDSLIWAATGYGLNKGVYDPKTDSWKWQNFHEEDYIGRGGVSAMAYMDDSTLWIATAFDTTIHEDNLPAGSGLSYTRDNGRTWHHVPQPVDSRYVTDYNPTTTVVQNLVYDIAFVDSTIWIASYGGGLRRSDDMGRTWQVVTTDGIYFSSGDNLNHRAFSLLSVEDTLWVGTAEGISKSADNGSTWQRFLSKGNDEQTISGNFIVSLAYQPDAHAVWAATVEAVGNEERRGVSRTVNGGKIWQRLLMDEGIFAHNFAFNGKEVYIPSDQGVWYRSQDDADWQVITTLSDPVSGEALVQEEYYSAAVQHYNGQDRLWLGSSDGLATRLLGSANAPWTIIRSYIPVSVRPEPAVYAYPVPFSPSRHLYVRFEYDENKSLDEPIKIFDFALNPVKTLGNDQLKPKWDGKNSSGDTVASGVYFFKAKVSGKVTWGKIVVIN